MSVGDGADVALWLRAHPQLRRRRIPVLDGSNEFGYSVKLNTLVSKLLYAS